MNTVHGILIFGANGSGKTTLGRELARKLNYMHMDAEDYYFLPSDIPYTASRTKEEVINLMLADIEKYGDFVLSAVTGDFGKEIISKYTFAVCLTTPLNVRLERMRERSLYQYGDRILPGGDMYENNNRFLEFAANRPLDIIDIFAETLTLPIIYLDGTKPIEQLLKEFAEGIH